jgi:hypothetical protein
MTTITKSSKEFITISILSISPFNFTRVLNITLKLLNDLKCEETFPYISVIIGSLIILLLLNG